MFRIVLFLSTFLYASSALGQSWDLNAKQARVEVHCLGNSGASCYALIVGRISIDTVKLLEALTDDYFDKVLLHSSGGDLNAGLRLGRFIRRSNLNTFVGEPIFHNSFDDFTDIGKGQCNSACAYAFLGGINRTLKKGDLLGFHRVSLKNGSVIPGTGGLIAGQILSSALVSYLVEMGVNPEIFARASSTPSDDLYFPSKDELSTLALSTGEGYFPFELKPFQKGVIAVSERIDKPFSKSLAHRLRAYCTKKKIAFEITTKIDVGYLEGRDDCVKWVEVDQTDIAISALSIEGNAENTFLTFLLDANMSSEIIGGRDLHVGLICDEASGSYHEVQITLNQHNKDSLEAAFRTCTMEK